MLEWCARGAVICPDDGGGARGLGVDEQFVEAEVVERLAVVVGEAAVEAARVGQQVGQCGNAAFSCGVVRGVGIGELLAEAVAFEVDLLEFLGEFVLGPVGVADEFEVGVFSVFQAGLLGPAR